MVAKKNGKGKPGVGEELGDPGQGGSGAGAKDRELVMDANAALMELSAEQRAVEKATEVQEEVDTAVLENEALKRELRAAKEVLEKRSEKEELRAKRAELEKRMARVRKGEDEWALRGGDRREGSRLESEERSRSRSRGSGGESPGRRRSKLPALPEGWRRVRSEERSRSRSRSLPRRVVIRSPERGDRKKTLTERSPPRRSPARRASPRRTSRERASPRRFSAGRLSPRRTSRERSSPRRSPARGASPRASLDRRSSRRARSREREERDLSSKRISAEIAVLKKQLELQEKQVKPWNKISHAKQDKVLKKLKKVNSVFGLALDTSGAARTFRRTSSLSSRQVRRWWRRGDENLGWRM